MRPRDGGELLLLGALWGASFLFMRIAAPEFGPAPLAFVRVAGASLLLLPLLQLRGQVAALKPHWRALLLVGVSNTALPFMLYNVATLVLTAGLAGIVNATAPLWGALVAWLWLHDRPSRKRLAGIAIGFAGVLFLAWDRAGVHDAAHGVSAPLGLACGLAATLCYGFSVNFTRRHLAAAPPLAVAAGSQLSASLALALPAWWWWPAQAPGVGAWGSAVVLALACTGLAYLLFFRLIAHVGPAQAIAVTYLIPAFAIGWGGFFLGEPLGLRLLLGCAVVLLGTALATGLIGRRGP